MDRENPIYFAIGDIHGENAKLAEIHAAMLERIAWEKKQPGFDGVRIIHLGDYVDRGPDTKGVIDRVMAFEKRFEHDDSIRVVSLLGNHEEMMLHALTTPLEGGADSWLKQGGNEAVDSYLAGGAVEGDWRNAIPKAHVDWMSGLPTMVYDADRKLAFVHAGIEPSTFPECREQLRIWTRSDRFFDASLWPDRDVLKGLCVVHGHTPKGFEPEVFPHRINVDTGACFGGPLTAVMLKPGQEPMFIRAA